MVEESVATELLCVGDRDVSDELVFFWVWYDNGGECGFHFGPLTLLPSPLAPPAVVMGMCEI